MRRSKDTEEAGGAVSGIIGEGIVPAAIEMMDALTIEAVEEACAPRLPEAGAVLIVELDGPEAEVANQFEQVIKICEENDASEIRVAEDDEERALFWKGRKAAFGAMGRISNDYYVQDGVVPRTELGRSSKKISELSRGIRPAGRKRLPRRRWKSASRSSSTTMTPRARPRGPRSWPAEIVFACLEHGGSLTGEHGIGRGQEEVHAQDVHRRRHERHAAPAVRLRPAPDLPTRARSSPPLASAANVPAPSTCTPSRRPASWSSSDADARKYPQKNFRRIVGADNFREATEQDAVDGVEPSFVVEPGSIEEISERDEAREPRGAGRLAPGQRHEVAPRRPARVDSTSS